MSNALEEKGAIQDVVHAYCYYVDERRWAELRSIFTDDGEWVAPYAHAKTGDEVVTVMDGLIPPEGQGPLRKHFVANLLIDLKGDKASARSNFHVVREAENGLMTTVCGTYEDTFHKVGGKWKIRKRIVHHDFMGDLGLRAKK